MEGIGHSEKDKWKILVHCEDSKIQQFHSLHSVNEAPCNSHLGISQQGRQLQEAQPQSTARHPESQRWTMTVIHSNKVRHVGTASLCNYGGGFAQHYLLKVQYKKSPKPASEQIFIKKDIVDNEHVEFST